MKSISFWSRRWLGIQFNELGLVLLLYVVFGIAYILVIYGTSSGQAYFVPNIFVDYGLKGLFAIPIWWLLFKKINDWKLWQKLLLHLLLLPLYIWSCQQSYYLIAEAADLWYMSYPAAWWDTYILGLFYVLQFGLFHVYHYYLELQKQQQLQAELREVALQAELSALKAQLNPHFLYNTFNAISASVPPDQESTREMIAKLSDLFRYQLKGTKYDLVPLKEELNFIKNYLELEKARFGERLEFEFNIAPEVENIAIPPMILQPIVENAIKHGISPKIEGGLISISILKREDEIHFKIRDTGVGLSHELTEEDYGIGLTNTKKRLEKIYNTPLEIINLKPSGVSVEFNCRTI